MLHKVQSIKTVAGIQEEDEFDENDSQIYPAQKFKNCIAFGFPIF